MADPEGPAVAQVLEYCEGEPDPGGDAALRVSCMLMGVVGFCGATVAMFAGAWWFRAPDLLGLYPISLMASVLATAAEGKWTRCVGLGAVAGSVFMSAVGYAAGTLIVN